MKKVIKKILLILLFIIIIISSIVAIIGYSYYSKALKEKPLLERVESVRNKEHFVPYSQLPKIYIDAVISTEDRRFYEHGSVDFIAIARAFYTNIRDKEFDEGGSTITQQVAKNIVFTQDKNIARKFGEIFAAYELEKNYSKDEILALYVNSSYFGDGYYSIYDASMGYYGKEPKDLNLNEASMLAGIPNAPSIYSPTVNPTLAKQRQTQVLNKMVGERYITQAEADEIIKNGIVQDSLKKSSK